MPRWVGAQTTRTIARPPRVVWDLLDDVDRIPDWVFLTSRITARSGSLGPGSTYEEVGPLGRSRWTVTEYAPPRRQVHEGRMLGLRVRITMTLEAAGTGSRGTQRIETTPWLGYVGWPVLKLSTWIITRSMARQASA